MGRLFARYLRDGVRELYLIDHFGVGARPASLLKTFEEVALGPGASHSDTRTFALAPRGVELAGRASDAWRIAPGSVDARSVAGMVWLGPATAPVDKERPSWK